MEFRGASEQFSVVGWNEFAQRLFARLSASRLSGLTVGKPQLERLRFLLAVLVSCQSSTTEGIKNVSWQTTHMPCAETVATVAALQT